MAEHLFIIQKEDESMFQQASCACNIEDLNRSKITEPTKKNQSTPRFAEIVNSMLTAILIESIDKSGRKDEDVQDIINEILVIAQNLR